MNPLCIEHKNYVQSLLKNMNTHFFEYSFGALFLFRQKYQISIDTGRFPCIFGVTGDDKRFLMPLFSIDESSIHILLDKCNDIDFVFPLSEKIAYRFSRYFSRVYYNEGDSDYIYLRTTFECYPTRALKRKRNLLKQAKRSFISSTSINEESLPDVLRVLDLWQNKTLYNSSKTDYIPCVEAVNYFFNLGLVGRIYYIGDNPIGFFIGEHFNDTTFISHFAKGLTACKGIYVYMFNDMALKMKSYKFLNFAQDLGLTGLRKSKESFSPICVNKKYRGVL